MIDRSPERSPFGFDQTNTISIPDFMLEQFQPVQILFLLRLRGLAKRMRDLQEKFPQSHSKIILMKKAIFSTYCDLVDLKLTDEAKDIISRNLPPPKNYPVNEDTASVS